MLYRPFILIYQKKRKNMRKIIVLIWFLLPAILHAQSTTRLEYKQAIALLLKNNFDIQVAKNNATIADVQNNWGSAGLLPKIDIIAGTSIASNQTRQEFSSGLTVNKNGVGSQNLNAGAFLSWTIFDGMKMFATKERLNLMEKQGALSLKLEIEQRLEQLTLIYYQAVSQEQLIAGIESAMQVGQERIKLYQMKLDIGAGSNVELLQARLDYNAQKSSLLSQKNLLNEYKINLLTLLKMGPETNFDVDSVFVFDTPNSLEEIKQKIEQANQQLLFAKQNVQIQSQALKEMQSFSLPRVGLTSSYNFSKNQNTAGFSLLNENLGYNVGLNLSWNIFNGFTTRNQIKIGKYLLQNSQIETDKIKFSFNNNASIAYSQLLNNQEILALEEENMKLSQEALKISLERLRIGLGNYLEIKESQSTFEASLSRLVAARYNLKKSETALKKLMGTLVQTN